MESRKIIHITSLLFILSLCVFISLSLHLFNGDDDKFFGNALQNRSLFEFLDWRYHTWTGRMMIEGLMVLTINHAWYWSIAIPLSCVITALSIANLAGYKSRLIPATSMIIAAILLINHNVIMEAMWWVTGSYNYIQPIAAGLLSILIHSKCKTTGKTAKLISFIMVVFSCFNEQFSILILIPYVLLYTLYTKNYSVYNISYLAISVIVTAFSLTAPGNKARSVTETASWMPDYANLGIIEKVALGFDRLSSHISEQNLIFTSFISILCFMAIKKGRLNLPSVIALFILVIKASTFFVFTRYSSYLNLLTHSDFLDFGSISEFVTYYPYILSLLVLFSCIQLTSIHCEDLRDLMMLVLPFILGITSVVVIGMSPTVYGSGYRILFIFNITVIFISAYLFKKII